MWGSSEEEEEDDSVGSPGDNGNLFWGLVLKWVTLGIYFGD